MTPAQAEDTVLGIFKTYWDANAPAQNNGDPVPVDYVNIKDLVFPSKTVPWARINAGGVINTEQHSFGATGGRRWLNRSRVLVQIYVPKGIGGSQQARALAHVAAMAFRGVQDGDLWFRDIEFYLRGEAVPTWFEADVYADYLYDDIG